MNFIKSLVSFFKKHPVYDDQKTPEGFCPNCWGRQEYGSKFYEVAKNYNTDINSSDPQLGWIQEYANKNLTGIVLQPKNDKIVCQNCKLIYSHEK
jgi:hypothetical protein